MKIHRYFSPFLPDPYPADHWHLADNRRGDGAIHVSVDHRVLSALLWRNRKSHAAVLSFVRSFLRSLSRSCVIFSVEGASESRAFSPSEFGGTMHDCVTPFIRSSFRPFVRSFSRWRTCKALITSTRRSRCCFRQCSSDPHPPFSLCGPPPESWKWAGSFYRFYSERCVKLGPVARRSQEARFVQFLRDKFALLSTEKCKFVRAVC